MRSGLAMKTTPRRMSSKRATTLMTNAPITTGRNPTRPHLEKFRPLWVRVSISDRGSNSTGTRGPIGNPCT
jgi:hypothetical protein